MRGTVIYLLKAPQLVSEEAAPPPPSSDSTVHFLPSDTNKRGEIGKQNSE